MAATSLSFDYLGIDCKPSIRNQESCKNLLSSDKVFTVLVLVFFPYVLKLRKLRNLFFLSTKKDTIICVHNIIPVTNLSLKLDIHFIHWMTCEIQIYFRICMANSRRKFKLLCAKLSSCLKYIKVRTALRLLICF